MVESAVEPAKLRQRDASPRLRSKPHPDVQRRRPSISPAVCKIALCAMLDGPELRNRSDGHYDRRSDLQGVEDDPVEWQDALMLSVTAEDLESYPRRQTLRPRRFRPGPGSRVPSQSRLPAAGTQGLCAGVAARTTSSTRKPLYWATRPTSEPSDSTICGASSVGPRSRWPIPNWRSSLQNGIWDGQISDGRTRPDCTN